MKNEDRTGDANGTVSGATASKKAGKARAKKREKGVMPDAVELSYNLFELPSAQHKAGLAGLMLFIENMRERNLAPLPEVLQQTETSVTLCLSRDALQAMFDDLYAVTDVETPSFSKWQGIQPLREEIITDKEGKPKKRYIYSQTVPHGRWLAHWAGDDADAWVKLWRDMLWNTLRAIPKTRDEYLQTKSKGRYDIEKLWADICAAPQNRRQVTGAIMLGAQDENAEHVPFGARGQDKLLMHFWNLVCPIYVPRLLKSSGGDIEPTYAGFVLALPEPSNLPEFVHQHRDYYLRRLATDMAGMRPRTAIIDLPTEGGLEYLLELALGRVGGGVDDTLLSGVEIHHLEKVGNSVKARSIERITPRRGLLGGYEAIRNRAANPLFKQMRITNLLAGREWYVDALRLFGEYPHVLFIYGPKTPRWFFFFGADVKRHLDAKQQEAAARGKTMTQTDDVLSIKVYQIVRTWVNRRTKEKCGMGFDDFKAGGSGGDRITVPDAYREAREKVCSDAFLAMRGRNGHDFIEYFVGNICAVPHYLPEDDYVQLSRQLLDDWERVKTLAMLALSAASYIPRGRVEDNTESAAPTSEA